MMGIADSFLVTILKFSSCRATSVVNLELLNEVMSRTP